MTVIPINKVGVYHFIFEPYLEGMERISRAWHGVNFHQISYPKLSIKHRLVSWLIGSILLIPLVNTMVWLIWQTFGKPEILSTHHRKSVLNIYSPYAEKEP